MEPCCEFSTCTDCLVCRGGSLVDHPRVMADSGRRRSRPSITQVVGGRCLRSQQSKEKFDDRPIRRAITSRKGMLDGPSDLRFARHRDWRHAVHFTRRNFHLVKILEADRQPFHDRPIRSRMPQHTLYVAKYARPPRRDRLLAHQPTCETNRWNSRHGCPPCHPAAGTLGPCRCRQWR